MVDNSFGDNSDFVNSSFVKTTYQFKLLIIGECNVGKTSLKIRYTENKFDPNVKPNAGIDFKVKTITLGTLETVKLSIWDTAGSEKYRSIANSYFNNAQGILLCFDISNRKSFEELNNFWIEFIHEYLETGTEKNKVCLVYLIGTKLDLAADRKVNSEEGKELAAKFGGKYYETSSLTGENVNLMFLDFTKELVEKYESIKSSLKNNDGMRLRKDSFYNKDAVSTFSKYHNDSTSSFCC